MPGSNSQGLQKSAADALRLGLTVFQTRGLGYAVCAQYFVAREREIQRHRDTETQRQKQRQRERDGFDRGEGLLGRNFDAILCN